MVAADQLRLRAERVAGAVESFLVEDGGELDRAAQLVCDVLRRRGTLFVCGNGGSSAHAVHVEAELLGRFRGERGSLPSLYLGGSPSTATAIGNDYGYDRVFSRPLEGLARAGDGLLAITTSGSSANVVAALDAARRRDLSTVLLTGPNAAAEADVVLRFPGDSADVVQDGHQLVIHALMDAVEAEFA